MSKGSHFQLLLMAFSYRRSRIMERMRRIPRQARSQQRVDQILNAAALEFAEVGYETATTNAIAARADVPIGSLYQFFPNKEAILEALVDRYVGELRRLYERTLKPEVTEGLPQRAIIQRLVQGIAEFKASNAAFGTIFLSAGMAEPAHAVHTEVIERVDALMAARFPALNPQRRRVCAVVCVGIVKGLMALMEPPDAIPAEQVVREIETALLAYIRAFVTQEGQPVPPDLLEE
jgi:AcrR family transcriptional regulator